MGKQTACETFNYKLQATTEQEWALEHTLQLCRARYNCTLEQSKTWWERGQGQSATYYQQEAELPDLKAACPNTPRTTHRSCRM